MTSQQPPLVWLITGVNSGFGQNLAEIARAAGHTVVGTVRSKSKFPAGLASAGVECVEAQLPLGSEAAAEAVVEDIVSRHGRLDVLVNNAGYGHLSAVEETSDAEVRRQLEVNVVAPVQLARAALPAMRARRSGVIINVSSIGGLLGFAGAGPYVMSKFALEGVSECLADEVRDLGVRVHVVEPGYFRTNFLAAQGRGERSSGRRVDAYADATASYAGYDGKQPGDPRKAARRMFELATLTGLCRGYADTLRVPLGTDCLAMGTEKMQKLQANWDFAQEVAKSTDFDE